MIKLLFTRTRGPFSWLIRWGTRSQWSHCDCVLPEGDVLGALFWRGVVRRPYAEALRHATQVGRADLPCDDPDRFYAFLSGQLGKPYDRAAIIGIGLADRHWARQDAWICSELQAAAAAAVGIDIQVEDPALLTPRDLWISPLLRNRDLEGAQ